MANYLQKLDRINWECEEENTRYLTHNYHPYSSKYIPQIPKNLMQIFSKKKDLILDNFVGSGTTLVECSLLSRNGIGVDINPLACLISKVKTTILNEKDLLAERNRQLEKIKNIIHLSRKEVNIGSLPNSNIIRWFQPQIIRELLIIKNSIDGIKEQNIRDFFQVAFSSIIRTVSNAASGFGNLMISKNPPKKDNVLKKYISKLDGMIDEMAQFNRVGDKSTNIKIFNRNTKNLDFIPNNSIDMICTHPPYMASVPYAEYQKLSLWWLGYDPGKLDQELIGGQRSRRDTAERYLRDMEGSFFEMYRVLKKNGFCCVVIGNPIYRGKIWLLNRHLVRIGEKEGFIFKKEIVRGKYKTTMGKMKHEYILIFKK